MRKTSLAAETFARAMVGKNVSIQKANTIKMVMLNQFRGHVNQLTGIGITNPMKRYWVFNDGLGGAWRFDFVIYPRQQLVIICSFYAVAANKSLLQPRKNTMQAQRVQTQENKSPQVNVMRLTEGDLRYIVSETTRRIVNKIDKYDGFKVVSHDTEITLNNGVKTHSYVGISDGLSTYHIASDDGCYVLYYKDNKASDGRMLKGPSNHWQPFIVRELKKLPDFPQ